MRLPYLITQKTLLEHVLIHGGTGQGKTATILAPMLEQLIRIAGRDRKSSVVVIDLKGDMALFHGIRMAAEDTGLPFKFVTHIPGRASFGMNPFQNGHIESLTRNQISEMLVRSFGLDFGNQYGASYFRDIALWFLRGVVSFSEINSIADLRQLVTDRPELIDIPSTNQKDLSHLLATLDTVSQQPALNVTPKNSSPEVLAESVDFDDVFERPQVVYLYLPTTLEDVLCFTTAKLACYLLLTAASVRGEGKDHQVFVCVDEFQRIVSQDFSIFLQQARSHGLACILACQTSGDLKSAGEAFPEIVRGNVNTQINLSAIENEEAARLIKQSPLGISWLDSEGTHSDSRRQVVVNSLDENDLAWITADRRKGLIRVASPHGLTQCGGQQVAFESMFHIPMDEFIRRQDLTWPAADDYPGSFVVVNERARNSPESATAKPNTTEKKGKPEKRTAKRKQSTPPENGTFQVRAQEFYEALLKRKRF